MSFYPDLSTYTYHVKVINPNFRNIGWLDDQHTVNQGPVSEEFLDRLWAYCQKSVREFRGFHFCDFCDAAIQPIISNRSKEELNLGAAEIRVPGKNDIVYIAPNLIYHYVTAHHYQPPAEFVEAVINSPHPNSATYFEFLDQLGVDYVFIDGEGEILAAGGSYRERVQNETYRAAIKESRRKK